MLLKCKERVILFNDFISLNFIFIRICRIFIRYSFIPNLQLETPTFKILGKAYCDGMSIFSPMATYESRMFLAKRLAGVPGYQYDTKNPFEYYQREVFSPEEREILNEHFKKIPGHECTRHISFDGKMYLFDFRKTVGIENFLDDSEHASVEPSSDWIMQNKNRVIELLHLEHPNELQISEVDERFIGMFMNDRKFHELSYNNRQKVKLAITATNQFENKFTKPFQEAIISFQIFLMKRFAKNGKFF